MKKVFLTLIFCQIFFIGSCQTRKQVQIKKQQASEISIPMDMTTYRPIVDVMIDGKGPYKFIFDTGATTNVIDKMKISNKLKVSA